MDDNDDGDDVLRNAAGVCLVFGGKGDDLVYDRWYLPGGPGSILDSGARFDQIWLECKSASSGLAFDFQVGGTQVLDDNRILPGIELVWIYGARFDDTLTTGRFDDFQGGYKGNHALRDSGGDDTLSGEWGATCWFCAARMTGQLAGAGPTPFSFPLIPRWRAMPVSLIFRVTTLSSLTALPLQPSAF